MQIKVNKPFISVIINCHNGEKYLSRSIKSILSQSYKNFEIVFFDNMSYDKSKIIIKSFKDKRIKYFKSKFFLNLYQARNQAISKAKGKYICFCDCDDWWIKHKLRIQVNFIKNKKKINFIYSNLKIFNEKTKKSYLYFKKMPSGNITQNLIDDYKLGILSVFMNKKLFKKNKFNQKYNIIGDFDFFLKLSLKEEFFCINKPLAFYRIHDTNLSKKNNLYIKEMNHWFIKNAIYFKNLKYSLIKLRFMYFKLRFKVFISQFLPY